MRSFRSGTNTAALLVGLSFVATTMTPTTALELRAGNRNNNKKSNSNNNSDNGGVLWL